jgi:hypothetical protein
VSIYQISKLLGHSDVKITQKYYAHLEPDRTIITPLRFCIPGIRLVALFMFFSSLSYVGYLLNALVNRGPWSDAVAGPQAAILVVYVIVLMILLRYPEPIARILSKGVPRISVRSRWTRVELVAAIIAGVAAYEMLSSIPAVFSRYFLQSFHSKRVPGTSLKGTPSFSECVPPPGTVSHGELSIIGTEAGEIRSVFRGSATRRLQFTPIRHQGYTNL